VTVDLVFDDHVPYGLQYGTHVTRDLIQCYGANDTRFLSSCTCDRSMCSTWGCITIGKISDRLISDNRRRQSTHVFQKIKIKPRSAEDI
jgi:hypothetical protein